MKDYTEQELNDFYITYDNMAYSANVKNGKVEYNQEYEREGKIVYTRKISEQEFNKHYTY